MDTHGQAARWVEASAELKFPQGAALECLEPRLLLDATLDWAAYVGGDAGTAAWDVAAAPTGESYVAGYGPGPLGGQDAFVAKVSASGAVVDLAYLGGSGVDQAFGIAVDGGSVYVTGETTSTDWLVGSYNGGFSDVFVAELDAGTLSVQSAVLLGGTGRERGNDIALDSGGSLFVAGSTTSNDWSDWVGGGYDETIVSDEGFVVRLNASLGVTAATYLGGSGIDAALALAFDAADNVYAVGGTNSTDFPGASAGSGNTDAFVVKLGNALTAADSYALLVGGSGNDDGLDIAVDAAGQAHIVGRTFSSDLPTTGGALAGTFQGGMTDGFAAKISADGTGADYLTYLGGSGDDDAIGVALDAGGNAIVVGTSNSADFLGAGAAPAGANDAYVARLNADAPGLDAFLFVGGTSVEIDFGVAMLPGSGEVFLAGLTGSSDLAPGPFNGIQDGFVAKVTISVAEPSQINGVVWEDFNNDGEINFGEAVIENVDVELYKDDGTGTYVYVTQTTTDEDGVYAFIGLEPGTYQVVELQPSTHNDGLDVVGTVDGSASGTLTGNDEISGIELSLPGSVGEGYNFAERPLEQGEVSDGQAAPVAFWLGRRGRQLLGQLNGGADDTQLGSWLAATFPNMFADLDGLTNAEIGSYYRQVVVRGIFRWWSNPRPRLLKARVLALALSTYVTNETLAGTTAEVYGLTVTQYGLGAAVYNVGDNGEPFGVDDDSDQTVMDLLLATDAESTDGLLYDADGDGGIDSSENSLRWQANWVYMGIIFSGR